MIIEEVSSDAYRAILRQPYHIFAGADFNVHNEKKAEQVYYLLFKDSKYRLGLIAAKIQNALVSPFSAPFGGLTPLHEDIKIQTIETAVDLLEMWTREKGLNSIKFTIPSYFYQESYLAKMMNVVYRKKFIIENLELNFHFDLINLTKEYSQNIWHNARKNLHIALANNLSFAKCDTLEQKQTAYQVIQSNRSVRGKPLRMTWQEVLATTKIIPADFFLVFDTNQKAMASAIVFEVAPKVVLVIYWGDIPDFQQLKTMNFLSFKIFEYYKERNFDFVDIGYSTEDSIPNYGLCEFKESIGCDITPKFTFSKNV